MGRIRTVKPDLFLHADLFDAERETKLPLRLAWIALFTACDREGRFRWKPRDMKAALMPYDSLEFSRVLDALHTRGFVIRYENDGRDYGYIPTWHAHQSINNRESESVFPSPFDASSTRDARGYDDGSDATKGKGREGKGREGKGASWTLPEWISAPSWRNFEDHRNRMRKPLTDHARALAVKELEGLKAKGHAPEQMIDTAILRGWQTFYEPSSYGKASPPSASKPNTYAGSSAVMLAKMAAAEREAREQ